MDRRLNSKQLRYRDDPHNPLGFYVFLRGSCCITLSMTRWR